jgi:hypothetical protein
MPSKSTFSGQPASPAVPFFPADADTMVHIERYLRKPASSPPLDGAGDGQEARLAARFPERQRENGSPPAADSRTGTLPDSRPGGGSAAALLTAQLSRFDRKLADGAADARQRNDLPRYRGTLPKT